jgi:hypothetical protein
LRPTQGGLFMIVVAEAHILKHVRKPGFIQASTASALLGWGKPGRASRFLGTLVERGLLDRRGAKRGTRYVAT